MFLIGCDPEFFLRDSNTKQLISAHDKVPGTKEEPHQLNDGSVQHDGLAVEIGIEPVDYDNFEEFNRRIVSVMSQVKKMVPGCNFEIVPSVQFDKEYYESLPEDVRELGCNPDFNAYTGEQNPAPDGSSGLRSAAGHIHIGWGKDIPVDHPDHLEICRNLTKQLDLFVGVPMLFIDGDKHRRKLYGRAGAFRPKPYGMEYRVPSNAWLINKASRRLIFKAVNGALKNMQATNPYWSYNERMYTEFKVDDTINNADLDVAIRLCQLYYPITLTPGMIAKARELHANV